MSSSVASTSASTKHSPTASTKPNRLPAPTLFVGPPSRNASQLSITRTTTHDPLTRHKSALSRSYNAADPVASNNTSPKDASASHQPLKKASEHSISSKWRSLQSTLNEVELTAQSSTHVFGSSHASALDDLRRAQVDLARAWGRGNENNPQHNLPTNNDINRFQGTEDMAQTRRDRADTGTSVSTALSGESRSGLEDETAADIKLASERRAANEAYFKKVDEGVRDVVQKLEVVAEAMRGVESESRSLWSTSSSSGGGGAATEGRGEKG